MRLLLAHVVLLAACQGATGEADDLCRAERRPDPAEDGALTVAVQLPGPDGLVHAEARWPDSVADPGSWPVGLVIQGTWSPVGTPVDRTSPRLALGDGLVGVHLDLPGNGRTDGENDRRGAASRAAVATVLGWMAGEVRDLGGCTLSDRVPAARADELYVVGPSNGGNLAVAALADPSLALPPVAGLVTWETPAGPQFTNVELGAVPSVYTPGSCVYATGSGITCDVPAERLVAAGDALCFDLDDDAACGAADVNVQGVQDLATGATMLSPVLVEAAAARGIDLPGYADAETADAWWAERDGARLAPALVEAQPDLPVLLLASEVDHVQTLADHPHVFGLGEALQRAGVAWIRLNPGAAWLSDVPSENAPNMPLRLADPQGDLVPEGVEDPLSDLLAAAVRELSERRRTREW